MVNKFTISSDLLNYRRYGTSSDNVIIFLHGVFGTGEDWIEEGYLQLLKIYEDVSLIFVDLRGHGQSVKPYSKKEYDPSKNADDVVYLMDTLGIAKAIIWGYSYGGRMAYAMGVYHSNRVKQLIVGSMHPFSVTNVIKLVEFRKSIIAKGMDAWLDYLDSQQIKITAYTRKTLLQNDNHALVSIDQCIIDWHGFEEINILYQIETILYFGERDHSYMDPVIEWYKNHPQCQLIVFDGKNHFTTFSDSDEIIEKIGSKLHIK